MMNAIAECVQGAIGQETLTQVIARDEMDPRRRRAPWLGNRINWNWPLKPPFPAGMSITIIVFCRIISQLVDRHAPRWAVDFEPVWQKAHCDCDFYEPCYRQRKLWGAKEVLFTVPGTDCT